MRRTQIGMIAAIAFGLGASAGSSTPSALMAGTARRPRFLDTPHRRTEFSTTRQDARIARTQRTVIVNGFELMQTIPSRERASKVLSAEA